MLDAVALLSQVFPGVDEDALQNIAALARAKSYPADTLLCREGVREEVFYLIAEGQVIITQQMGAEERVLRYSGPGEYFGEMALIADSPRNASVRTTSEATFLEIDKELFAEMIAQFPVIALSMIRTAVEWIRVNDATAIAMLHQRNQELDKAYQALRDQEEQRSRFLTTLAHELRTPLTTASGFMQLIRNGKVSGPGLQMGLDKIAGSLENVVSLVNDLLFVQEMDMIAPSIRPIDLPDLLRMISEEAEDDAARNELVIQVNIPSALPPIEADPDGLARALRALLDNAIKFSPNGGEIRIDVQIFADYLDILFIDPGIGIEPDFLPRIFDRFEHLDQRGDFLFGGIGLGLSIARHLIESFGGDILVQSEVDRGSVFTVRLPILIKSQPSDVAETGENRAS